MRIGHGNSTQLYMDTNFYPERMNFWERMVLNLLNLTVIEDQIDDDQNTTEYEKSTESSIATVFQIHALYITGYLLLFIIPAIV